jgi:predicted O-methyltransferase YrrM
MNAKLRPLLRRALAELKRQARFLITGVRSGLETLGVHVLKANFHAPVPTIAEIKGSWEKRDGQTPYLEPELYDNSALLRFLAEDLHPYAEAFNPPVEPTGRIDEFHWNNWMFSYSDALAYYCMVRRFRPQHIIEVGSGYSSLVAAQALRDNGQGELILIEPYPPEFLKALGSARLIQKPVQEIPVSFFQEMLGENDILFIDSTHTVKCGGDCVYLYLKILPRLKAGVIVHAHDIFLPSMMPEDTQIFRGHHWTEQYLLQAYLLDNPKVKVLFGSHYHNIVNREALESFMHGKYGARGGSFWFAKV